MPEAHPMTKLVLAHPVPGTDAVEVRSGIAYGDSDGGLLVFDLYLPPAAAAAAPPPAVVMVPGYPDPGLLAFTGCRFKDMGSTTSWARALAASGMAAIAPTNVKPSRDLATLLGQLPRRARELRIDATRLGLWATSGNGPVALSALLRPMPAPLRCAALLYPLTLDLDGATDVADNARSFGFESACAGRGIGDLSSQVPILLVRAGRDQFVGLNRALDRLAAKALDANLPLTLVNQPEAAHAFDLEDRSAAARAAVDQVLHFLGSRLRR